MVFNRVAQFRMIIVALKIDFFNTISIKHNTTFLVL